MYRVVFYLLFLFTPPILKGQNTTLQTNGFPENLVTAARARTLVHVTYNGSYMTIPYPGGDVPDNIGVCTDLVIRTYRKLGFDFQRAVHDDMMQHFDKYPQLWNLQRPDSNIDHRRVPNLQTWLTRHGCSLPFSESPDDFLPGDLVTWMLPGHLPHIGIVSDSLSPDNKRLLVIHNIGDGPAIEDVLFAYPLTGHYRFNPNQTGE